MKTIAIVQARMSSTRFQAKVLAELCGMPMLEVILHRLKLSELLDDIVVATTSSKTDDSLVDWLISSNIKHFRGSETDVLERFYLCAKQYNADLIVRITADDPLKDAAVIDRAIKEFKSHPSVDYVSNTLSPTYPEGLDVEVFSFSALERAHREARLASEREHVTPYIWKNKDVFHAIGFSMTPDYSSWRWTVDKPEDLEFIRAVLSNLNNDIETSYIDIIALLNQQPTLLEINQGTARNEGYFISLEMENKNA